MSRAESLKRGYTDGARRVAARSMLGLARTRVTPNGLTAAGVTLCAVAAVLVFFENRDELVFYWLGAATFVLGSILDILDGALARTSGKGTPFGAFLDSTLDRLSESAIFVGVIFFYAASSKPNEALLAGVAMTFSLMTSYARARAEGLDLKCEVGLLERAGRVLILSLFSLVGFLTVGVGLVAVGALVTTIQRIVHVRRVTRS